MERISIKALHCSVEWRYVFPGKFSSRESLGAGDDGIFCKGSLELAIRLRLRFDSTSLI